MRASPCVDNMKVNATVLLSLVAATVNALPAGSSTTESTWDVIVVGAGPAGIVVADRMSEAGRRTLLLEQGGPSYYITGGRERPGWLNNTELSRVDVPGLYKSIYSNPSQELLCPAEKLNGYGACTIGGNTAINAGLWFQPPATDFDRYFPDSWKSKDMQGAIEKVRKQQPFTSNPRTNGSAVSGYYAAKQLLVDGAGYKDVEFNHVPNQKVKTFGHTEFMYENGQRSGPVKTYLQSSLKRENFKFQSGVQVKRVVRDGAKATGVDVTINGKDSTIKLRPQGGRIILSGGALFSPQLLMLSGIGDTAVLQNLSTNGLLKTDSKTWIENKAVGAGLFDNPNTFIELSGPSVTPYVYNYASPIPADRDAYLQHREGPYTFASETSAFWNEYRYPNGDAVGVQGTIDSSGFGEYVDRNTITLNIYGTSGMRSLGQVALNMKTGAPGQEKPFFYTDSEGQDADAIASFVHDIFASLSKSGLTPRNIPANASKDDIKKYITTASQYTLGNVNHWSSSCRLGQCVDTSTVVKGTSNLHVVDGSIVPPLTTNPSFGIVIAAERASEIILALKA
ncbi:hypothetical protein DOTSEDRAFT_75559 [Dothistroma septosporum NZE10]|uniref:Glucose-methanol-choline oxidoreductase N-terminal domain-containing protein n=1 Tax=Dothistroma septosporum (strain NZE10 / CBS 128990) TaxID=675120 RepID=M2Y0Q9_DOTSN|nr:hypothetical protein DOTSEDRAFT_75559 [Dothistroma septosporum NZE10]